MANLSLNHAFDCSARRSRIFQGDILVYSQNPDVIRLTQHAKGMIAQALAPHEPELAQFHLPVEDFIARVGPLKTRFTNDAQTKVFMREILAAFDCDLAKTYFDVPRLRVVPHGGYLASGVSYAYKAHRDVWYSSPAAQVNWWSPVFPVTPERAMSFYPAYWSTALPNGSADFDYGEWCRVGRQQATAQITTDTRKHPLPQAPVDETSELRIAGTEGDTILFSANHLHATAPNGSGRTRFSIDFRTIHLDDLTQGAGAPLIDCAATGTTLGDFLRASDFTPYPLP